MMGSSFLLCGVPAELWGDGDSSSDRFSDLRQLIDDALAIERRLPKEVNLEDERSRYDRYCRLIENLVSEQTFLAKDLNEFETIAKGGRFPGILLGEEYLRMLVELSRNGTDHPQSAIPGIGGSLFPPGSVGRHAEAFEQVALESGWWDKATVKLRKEFFDRVRNVNYGVVEIQIPMVRYSKEIPDVLSRKISGDQPLKVHPPSAEAEPLSGERRDRIAQQLRNRISATAGTHEPVNLSNQPHDISTEVLREFVYSEDASTPQQIPVVFADGSRGEPFLISCLGLDRLEKYRHLIARPPLRVALISMRHLELDRVVDMSWFRNREASRSRSLSEAEIFCYEFTRDQIREMEAISREANGLQVHLYHTGFEAAVVGFYRAFVHAARSWEDDFPGILISPRYYRGEEPFEVGSLWA